MENSDSASGYSAGQTLDSTTDNTSALSNDAPQTSLFDPEAQSEQGGSYMLGQWKNEDSSLAPWSSANKRYSSET
ncbi:hypothetical protein N7457_005617 [Penicillium paradoxum]|uniref:uncharacterized protein n=1 Tax=Penicillium paradoxum TaxID=176176 RepID=UPI0025490433|nr:uncharacterized protein N7457_005617 [Penicillium paradoxum]KAJ5780457.1 hypothetical protein N7457_005617 [Penicillium paradoxum]